MSKFYTIPAYTGGALGGLMLGAARGEGDSYDKGWTGLLTGLGTTAGIGGSHYLTKQLENWDDKLQRNIDKAKTMPSIIDADNTAIRDSEQYIKEALERNRVRSELLQNQKQLASYALKNGDAAKLKELDSIFQTAGADSPKFKAALDDLLQATENRVRYKLRSEEDVIGMTKKTIDRLLKDVNAHKSELASVKKYLNNPMNRLAKKVPLITGLKWLSALALPTAGFVGAKSLGDYFSSKA